MEENLKSPALKSKGEKHRAQRSTGTCAYKWEAEFSFPSARERLDCWRSLRFLMLSFFSQPFAGLNKLDYFFFWWNQSIFIMVKWKNTNKWNKAVPGHTLYWRQRSEMDIIDRLHTRAHWNVSPSNLRKWELLWQVQSRGNQHGEDKELLKFYWL